MMPSPDDGGGVCYKNGEVVKQNYQMCDVTNIKIVEILDEDKTCDFQCKFR
jgi:hypothetical protein